MNTKNSFKLHGGRGTNSGPRQAINVNPDDLPSLHCPNCATNAFQMVYQFLEVPTLLAPSPDGRPQILRVESAMCVRCGAVWAMQGLRRVEAKDREAMRALQAAQMEMQQAEGSEEEINLKKEDLL